MKKFSEMNAKELREELRTTFKEMERINNKVKSGEYTKEDLESFDKLDERFNEMQSQYDFLKNEGKYKTIAADGSEEDWYESKGKQLRNGRNSVNIIDSKSGTKVRNEDEVSLGEVVRAYVTGAQTDAEERALSAGTDSAGGYTVNDRLMSDFIDKLRPNLTIVRAGAQVMYFDQGTHGDVKLAKVTGDSAVDWLAENATDSVDDMTFGETKFSFKTLRALETASRELLQDSVNFPSIFEQTMARQFAVEIDRVAYEGASGSGEPVGIANYSSKQTQAVGNPWTNGWDDVSEIVKDILAANAPAPTFLTLHPTDAKTLFDLEASTSRLSPPWHLGVAQDGLLGPAMGDSYPLPVYQSANITQGTGYVGHGPSLMIGIRQGLRIQILQERFAENFQVGFVASMRADIQPTQEAAFGDLTGITVT